MDLQEGWTRKSVGQGHWGAPLPWVPRFHASFCSFLTRRVRLAWGNRRGHGHEQEAQPNPAQDLPALGHASLGRSVSSLREWEGPYGPQYYPASHFSDHEVGVQKCDLAQPTGHPGDAHSHPSGPIWPPGFGLSRHNLSPLPQCPLHCGRTRGLTHHLAQYPAPSTQHPPGLRRGVIECTKPTHHPI